MIVLQVYSALVDAKLLRKDKQEYKRTANEIKEDQVLLPPLAKVCPALMSVWLCVDASVIANGPCKAKHHG